VAPAEERLARFRSGQRRGLFLDFDGSLSPIVRRPEDARPLVGVVPLLESLAERHVLVAVVSGRTTAGVTELLPARGVTMLGQYGIPDGVTLPAEIAQRARAIASRAEGARVEDKGVSVAVHVREALDPGRATAELRPALEALAASAGLILLTGKMVLELAPADTPGKGEVVLRTALDMDLDAVLYAGDDRADLDAFGALDRLAAEGRATVKVAVRTEETPEPLLERADFLVEGPKGLVQLLGSL